MNLILCGYKACGKTTVAKAYSETFHYSFIDTDHLICDALSTNLGGKQTIRDIYSSLGHPKFQQMESTLVQSIKNPRNTIIATGGGTLLDSSSVKHLKTLGKIVYLYVNKNTLYERILSAEKLPGFINKDNIINNLESYLMSRDEIYNNVCDHSINASNKTIAEIVLMIEQYRCKHGK